MTDAPSPAEDRAPGEATLRRISTKEYEVSGPRQLRGTLKRQGDGPWVLDVRLTFPTGGYSVGEPIVRMTRSMPPHVLISIPVTTPKPDDLVTMALSGGSATVEIAAPDDSFFKVFVTETERE